LGDKSQGDVSRIKQSTQESPSMEARLEPNEIRVLGCLIEKDLSTPEYYPLTINAIAAAANQKSNRDPVMDLTEEDVADAIEVLSIRRYVVRAGEGGRVPKYRHLLGDVMHLEDPVLAILAELLLRGPQTIGELRARGDRMAPLPDNAVVEAALAELTSLHPAWVECLPKRPGHKEPRYRQLLGREDVVTTVLPEPPVAGSLDLRVLEAQIAELRQQLATLRSDFEAFRGQFE
jgi:uncharacterized protein